MVNIRSCSCCVFCEPLRYSQLLLLHMPLVAKGISTAFQIARCKAGSLTTLTCRLIASISVFTFVGDHFAAAATSAAAASYAVAPSWGSSRAGKRDLALV